MPETIRLSQIQGWILEQIGRGRTRFTLKLDPMRGVFEVEAE